MADPEVISHHSLNIVRESSTSIRGLGVRTHGAGGGSALGSEEDGHRGLEAGPELAVLVLEFGTDPNGGGHFRGHLGIDERDLAAELLLLDGQRRIARTLDSQLDLDFLSFFDPVT